MSAASDAAQAGGTTAFKAIPSGDINALLQEQRNAAKWTLALNEAIKCWTDEHAAMVQTPRSPNKMIRFEECMLAGTFKRGPTPEVQFESQISTQSSGKAIDDLHKVWSNVSSPWGGAESSLSKPLLYDLGKEDTSTCAQLASKADSILSTSLIQSRSLTEEVLQTYEPPQQYQHDMPEEEKDSGHGPHGMVRNRRVDQLLFPHKDKAFQTVQGYLNRAEAGAEDKLSTEGVWQACARSARFNNISLFVILMNTIWIAIDTDYNHAEVLCEASPVFQVVDNFFCIFFCFELFVRLMAFKKRSNALRDPWYVFDAVLVSLMVWETWIQVLLYMTIGGGAFEYGRVATIFRIFRLARLTRVARTGKLLRSTPELLILAKAMFLALRSVMAVLVMLTLVIYVFAILFTQLLQNSHLAKNKFENVPQSMNFLLIQLLCGFDSQFMIDCVSTGLAYYFIFLIFLLIANMTIMNMLIGILCDVVAGVSEAAKEENFIKDIEGHLDELSAKIDPDGDKIVSKEEFHNIMADYDLVHALNNTGVDVLSFMEYASFVFQDEAELRYDDFVQMILQFRGDRVATVKELVNTRKYITNLFESMEMQLPK